MSANAMNPTTTKNDTRRRRSKTGMFASVLLLFSLTASAQDFVPEVAFTETLDSYQNKGWFWVSGIRAPNMADGRAFLYGNQAQMLGQLSTGFWFNSLVSADKRNEIITVETYFSRGTRGERTDVVVRYDPKTLSPIDEIEIPAKRMNSVKNSGLVTLSEDEKLLLVVNYTPAQSVSVVNLETGQFVEEIETPGCSVLYTGGQRDFYSICGNGGFMHIRLDDNGQLVELSRTEKLFDPVDDFLSIAASRLGNTWYFVSKQNQVYAIEMTPEKIVLKESWPLTTPDEKEDEWLISGMHHTAIHEASGQLFVVMHQGPPESFEEPGTSVWVYDLETKTKVKEIEMEDLTISIAITPDPEPRLLTLDAYVPMNLLFTAWIYLTEGEAEIIKLLKQRVNIYDLDTGDHITTTEPLPVGFVYNIQAW